MIVFILHSYKLDFISTRWQFHLWTKWLDYRVAVWRVIFFGSCLDLQLIFRPWFLFCLALHIRSLLVLLLSLSNRIKILWMAGYETFRASLSVNTWMVCLKFWSRCKMILFVPYLIVSLFSYRNKMTCQFLFSACVVRISRQSDWSCWLLQTYLLLQF